MAIMHLGPQSVPKVAPSLFIATTTTPIYVIGAGSANVNGEYEWAGSTWFKAASTCSIEHLAGTWNLKEGITTRYVNSGGDSSNLPRTGWTVNIGSSPAPTISETAP